MTSLDPDEVHRTILLGAHDGSQPTLEAARTAHDRTGILICADTSTCRDLSGQAALLTAVVTARRAFGTTAVLAADGTAVIPSGIFARQTVADAAAAQGAVIVTDAQARVNPDWPFLLLGDRTPAPGASRLATIRASWSGWTARVARTQRPAVGGNGSFCVPAAIASASLGVSEAFGAVRARPGSDAGDRDVVVNLWDPDMAGDSNGPDLAYAPSAWWLAGLGHLGQAAAWVISWLPYAEPSEVEIVLQDTGQTAPANYSTGVLTPEGSDRVLKTRLVAAVLEKAGFTTRIIEREVGADLRVVPAECHVAILGFDNLRARGLISDVGWALAVDVGLGERPDTFDSIVVRRFPGAQRSAEVTAWQEGNSRPADIPTTPAFTDLLSHHDQCGVTELAGKAVGAAFVGVTGACLAIAEATRELHGGTGTDTRVLSLASMTDRFAAASQRARLVSAPLQPQYRAISRRH